MNEAVAAGRRAKWPAYLKTVYGVEGLTTIGANILMVGIYFYTEHVFQWGLIENFLLAAAQGTVYIVGSLSAHRLTERFGKRGFLATVYALAALTALVALFVREPAAVAALLLAYTFLISINWPALESMASGGADAHQLARRIAVYNLVWSGGGALAVAGIGWFIEHGRAGVFLVPVAVHVAGALLIWFGPQPPSHAAADGHAPLRAEPELERARVLALWLSRASLPATYVVIYSLVSMFPLLPVVRELGPTESTLLGSLWMAVRWLTFLGMGLTAWWHSRPGALLVAAVAMAAAFFAIALPGARLWAWDDLSLAASVAWMVVGMIGLGVCVGWIYFGSLYFGMVLSDGSTEHGGYHEALIGLGQAAGPAAGALAAYLYPGNVPVGIAAVTVMIAASVATTAGVGLAARVRRRREA